MWKLRFGRFIGVNSQLIMRVLALFTGLSLLSGCLLDRIGGAFTQQPEELEKSASPEARKLIDQAFAAIDASRLVDFHTHILAIGTSVGDAFVHPRMLSGVSLERVKFWIYESAAGIRSEENTDEEYVARLVRLARAAAPRGRFRILAFDKHYNADGSVNLGKTNMYVPNHYIVELGKKYSDVFTPVISVHRGLLMESGSPFRPTAIRSD